VRVRALISMVLVVAGTIAGGTLECDPILFTPAEAHGAEVYGRMCAVCHGASGEGYKADEATALAQPDFLASVTDDYLRAAITKGRDGTTMSAWGMERGGPLAKPDVNAVIAFLRTRADGRTAKLDERPLAGDATRGATTFARDCARCHGARGTGGPNVNIGNPQLLLTASNGFLRLAITGGRPPTVMPAFRADPGEVEDIVSLLRSWQSSPATAPLRPAPPAKPPPIPLGPVPLNPTGRDPTDFTATPGYTKADVVEADLRRGAKMGILDARAPSDYANEHIAGAVSVPFYDPEPYVSSLPKDAWLVCYCGCPHAESSQLAQKLRAKGFTKVTVIDEGLRYWKKKDYGVRVGLVP
jgi:cytochrome c oxidase cbb3-type subunit III